MLSDENRTLVAEGNVAKINQRFKELEAELRAVREDVKILTNAVGTAQNLIHAAVADRPQPNTAPRASVRGRESFDQRYTVFAFQPGTSAAMRGGSQ